MKSFRQFLEETPANVSSGLGVRGFGDVSGNPAGAINTYAAANASAPPIAADMVAQHLDLHNAPTVGDGTIEAGIDADTKDNILNKKSKGKDNGTVEN